MLRSARHSVALRSITMLLGGALTAPDAFAGATIQLGPTRVVNAQTPINGDPLVAIPTTTNQYFSGALTGVTVKATSCYWTNVNPQSGGCDGLVWPAAGDLAVIVRKPASSGIGYEILLQVGGATRLPSAGARYPWVQTNSSQGTPGTCGGSLLGCAGGTPGTWSPCSPMNSGGATNYVDQAVAVPTGDWTSAIPMDQSVEVVLAWLPALNGNTQNPPSNQWTDTPQPSGSPALFCDIEISCGGVTEVSGPPCEHPTYRSTDACECSPTDSGGDPVHAVEIRFANRSGIEPSEVKLLPYSCAKSFSTTSNPGALYSDAACSQLLWRDGLFSAASPNSVTVSGCGHLPSWTSGNPCSTQTSSTPVPVRTLRLTDLVANGDGTYSLWTNHFPDAIWYIGLPQLKADGTCTAVPDVPFFFTLHDASAQYNATDVLEISGLDYIWRGVDPLTGLQYFSPASPSAGKNASPWPVVAAGDCEQPPSPGCTSQTSGVDWQQLEITMDGSPADIADITYIDFSNVPVRLESYSDSGPTPIQATGYAAVADATATSHPAFSSLVQALRSQFPENLYLECPSGGSGTGVLQSAGPNQSDATCGDSMFVPPGYPAHLPIPPCPVSGTITDFRAVFDRALTHSSRFPGHATMGCGWIRDWLGSPTSGNKFDYDFALALSKNTSTPGQVSYTATLSGFVKVWDGSGSQVYPPLPPSTPPTLTIVLGTDTYYTDPTKAPRLDLTRAIYLAPTPGNMPLPLGVPSECTSQSLATLSLFATGDSQAGSDPRLSESWVAVMSHIDTSAGSVASNWFGADANENVTALIGRLMGDAYAGFALGFLASEQANPIIPAGGLTTWPTFGNTYPTSSTAESELCYYDSATPPGQPFWKTPSGSWWGGALFPSNSLGGATHYWSDDCGAKIFTKHYSDVAPQVQGKYMCSAWGDLIHQSTAGGYSHPIEDRMANYNAGISGYEYAGEPITRLDVTFWRGISSTGFAGCPVHCPADLNHDSVVTGLDLNYWLAGYTGELPCGQNCTADLNADGMVNGLDLTYLLSAWGPCP